MIRGIFALRAISGVIFLTQLTLGILFWTGHALSLIPLHMNLGSLFVVSLLTLAALSARAGAPRAPVAALASVAMIILVVGFTQMRLVPGPFHWVVRVVHLALGVLAMPIAGRLPTLLPSGSRPFGRGQDAGSVPQGF